MILCDGARIAAAYFAEADLEVHEVPYAKLLPVLRERKQLLKIAEVDPT